MSSKFVTLLVLNGLSVLIIPQSTTNQGKFTYQISYFSLNCQWVVMSITNIGLVCWSKKLMISVSVIPLPTPVTHPEAIRTLLGWAAKATLVRAKMVITFLMSSSDTCRYDWSIRYGWRPGWCLHFSSILKEYQCLPTNVHWINTILWIFLLYFP